MKEINKILVANRGEIAMRVLKSAKAMGIKTVAIYSEADRNALHTRYADESVCVGPPPSSESYLQADKIIEVCKELGVDGIHPGYGFLSENADFARKVTEAGITFIGPSPESIEVMGDKLAAKATVTKFNIPLVPGSDGAITDIAEAKKLAGEIGFPIMIKASAGGGGKGMRIVRSEAEFEEQMDRAVSEAVSSFGNGEVFIEKYIGSPKHIEIQVLADTHGNTVYLFERECSVQRRHQKVVEEAPSPVVDEAMRKAMGECAVDVAKSCNYVGAGTVEFIVDEDLNFYFLEMNTRLQVEHPVTELITGVDLVKEQINVAKGEKLAFTQDDLTITGHSVELRLYAEDPEDNFTPDIGVLEEFEAPNADFVRLDTGFVKGMEIPIYYDPMLAKVITYGKDRAEAIQNMLWTIENFKLKGVKTTLPFGKFVLTHPSFLSGKFDTHFVANYWSPEILENEHKENAEVAALFTEHLLEQPRWNNFDREKNESNWTARKA